MVVSKIPRGRMLELEEASSMIFMARDCGKLLHHGRRLRSFRRPGDLLTVREATRVIKLYYAPGACSLAPHIALEEVGARYELSRVDLAANQQNSAEYLRINPKARVPALIDGDWVLTEAPAILAT